MNNRKKTFIIGLSLFAAVVAGVFIVYILRKPNESIAPPSTPRPTSLPEQSPVTPEVNVVAPQDAKCELSFTVSEDLLPGLNCQAKELYKDVAANTAGQYAITTANKLPSNFEMIPGDTYIYVVSYKNTGTGATAGTITDVLPAGITYKDSTSGCTYVGSTRTVTCTIASVAANATGQVAIRFTVNSNVSEDEIANSATLTPASGTASVCRLTNPVKPSGSPKPSTSASPSPSSSASPSPSSSPSLSGELECVVKRAYEDASNNTAGQYYLNTEINDANTLQNDQVIVYNVRFANHGGASVPDVKVTDVLSSNLTYVDGESGCTYDSGNRTVTCNVGTLAANTETSRSFRVRIGVAGTSAIANTADVFSTNGQRDSCSITVNAAGQVVQPPSPAPTELPQAGVFEVTAGTLGLGLLLLLAGALGLLLL